jgi:hypothetical protein
MDKLLAMTTFVRIVERGSLTAAAAALDTSLPWSCVGWRSSRSRSASGY